MPWSPTRYNGERLGIWVVTYLFPRLLLYREETGYLDRIFVVSFPTIYITYILDNDS